MEIETLVFSARDQNHRFGLGLQRFFRRIQVRRFGIVYVIDPGDRPDEFTAVGRWFICTQRRRHLLEGQSAEVTDRERCHQIFDVVRAAQFDIGQPQYRSCLETNRSISQTKIRAIVVGAEGQALCFDLRQVIACIDNSEILLGLIFKDAQLGPVIHRDRGVTIEMVGREVQPHRNLRAKSLDRFELERADFGRQNIELRLMAHDFAQGFANVAAGNGALTARVQHLRDQLRCRGLAIGAGDGDERQFAKLPAQLELADHFNLSRRKILREWGIGIDSRAQDRQVARIAICFRGRTADYMHTMVSQIFDRRFRQLIFRRAVEHADVRIMRAQQ